MYLGASLIAVLATIVGVYAGPANRGVCDDLEKALPGRTFYARSSAYVDVTSHYFSRQQSSLQPSCVLRPRSACDVSTAIKIIARKKAKFATKSGGHSPNRGFSNIENGVTIDFDSFKAVTLRKDKSSVSIQPGATWAEVYNVLDQYGIVTLGGRTGVVGSAGLILGGGISGFSKDKGWVCDNVLNFEVVLASSKIVNANATHHSDLFQALKGGQNNFGIVTRIDLAAVQHPPFLGGSVVYGEAATDAAISAFQDLKDGPFDPYEEVEQSFAFISAYNMTQIIETLWYPDSARNPNGLKRWTEIQPQLSNTLRTSTMSDFAREIDGFLILDKYAIFATTTFLITPTILKKVHKLWQGAIDDTFRKNGVDSVMTWQSLPSNKNANNVLGLQHVAAPEKDHVLLLFGKYWGSDSLTRKVEKRTLQLIADIDKAAAKENASVKYRYLNYAHYDQKVFEGYGRESLRFMRAVSKRYDPEGVFQRQTGGFKLW